MMTTFGSDRAGHCLHSNLCTGSARKFLETPSASCLGAGTGLQVKALAAELKMDRRDVLTWLRRPPPEAVQLAAAGEAWLAPARNRAPSVPAAEGRSQAAAVPRGFEEAGPAQDGLSGPGPSVHADDAAERWDRGGKRIGREQLATLEAVFQRTRHPTVSPCLPVLLSLQMP